MDPRPAGGHRHTILLSDTGTGRSGSANGGAPMQRSQCVPLPPLIPCAATEVVPAFVHRISGPEGGKGKCTCGEHSASSIENYCFETGSTTTCGCSDPLHRSFSTVSSVADSGLATPQCLSVMRKKIDPLSLSEDDDDDDDHQDRGTTAILAEHASDNLAFRPPSRNTTFHDAALATPRSDGGTEIIVVAPQQQP